ncbi:MAG: alpha/beta hydrolase [Phaeodactylibacter sp.]|nr:alpha/beta hydrolase [Phaeodactylibacter sp.]MCB9303134.1 alpha/beta hydrolase [Lewinellaceae bacterium]
MQESRFDIDINQSRLNVLEILPGSSEEVPLVFLHDALGSVAQWRNFPHTLAALTGRRAIVYDRPGHGGSSPFLEKRTQDYLQHEAWEVLPQLLNALSIEKPVLIGHSDGGSIALLYATRFPATAVITEAAHVFVEDTTLEGIRQAVANRKKIVKRLRKYHGEKADVLFEAWAATWLDPAYKYWDIRTLLPAIACPVLVIQGAEDAYGSAAQVQAIVAAIETLATPLLIPGCGHIPHWEAEETLMIQIRKFLGQPGPNHNKTIQDETFKLHQRHE